MGVAGGEIIFRGGRASRSIVPAGIFADAGLRGRAVRPPAAARGSALTGTLPSAMPRPRPKIT